MYACGKSDDYCPSGSERRLRVDAGFYSGPVLDTESLPDDTHRSEQIQCGPGKSKFRGIFLCTVVILFHVEWCIRQISCPSTISSNITSIASHITTILISTLFKHINIYINQRRQLLLSGYQTAVSSR